MRIYSKVNKVIIKENKEEEKEKVPIDNNRQKRKEFSLENFKSLKEKYDLLEKEFNLIKNKENETWIKTGEDQYMENLKNILKDKEEKVAQLFVLIKEKGQENENIDNNESYLKMKVDELDKYTSR